MDRFTINLQPCTDNLPKYVQMDEDVLVKYIERDGDYFIAMLCGDEEEVHHIYAKNGYIMYDKPKVDEEGETWDKALNIIDTMWLNLDWVQDLPGYFKSLVEA